MILATLGLKVTDALLKSTVQATAKKLLKRPQEKMAFAKAIDDTVDSLRESGYELEGEGLPYDSFFTLPEVTEVLWSGVCDLSRTPFFRH